MMITSDHSWHEYQLKKCGVKVKKAFSKYIEKKKEKTENDVIGKMQW